MKATNTLLTILLVFVGFLCIKSIYKNFDKEAMERGNNYYQNSEFKDEILDLKCKFSDYAYDGKKKEYHQVLKQRNEVVKKMRADLQKKYSKFKVYPRSWLIYHEQNGSGKINGIDTPDPLILIFD